MEAVMMLKLLVADKLYKQQTIVSRPLTATLPCIHSSDIFVNGN